MVRLETSKYYTADLPQGTKDLSIMIFRAGEVALLVRVLAVLPKDQSSVPSTYIFVWFITTYNSSSMGI